MAFKVNDQYHPAIIEISGKFLGSIEGAALKEAVTRLKEGGNTQVVIDLSKADFMDSSGIGALISTLTTLRTAGGDVRLAGLEKRIKNLFLITRLLGPVFDDYPDVEAALQSFKDNPPAPAEI